MWYMHDQPGWQKSAMRLVDVFVDGLRVQIKGDRAQSRHRAVRRWGSQEIGGVKPARAGIKNRSFRSSGLTSSAHKSPNAARLIQAAEASTWLKTDHHLMSAGAAWSAHQMRTVVDVPALGKASALGRIPDLI
jgi:hypothetical protein